MLLESLLIENYRAFRRLEVPQLGRVNLFVGKNNTGKSSVLEAGYLHATRGAAYALWHLLQTRNGIRGEASVEQLLEAFRNLFHGREESLPQHMTIGPAGSALRLSLSWAHPAGADIPAPILEIAADHKTPERYPLESFIRAASLPPRASPTPVEFVRPSGMTVEHVARAWDEIALTEDEEAVIRAMQIITPDVERMSVIGRPAVVIAKLSGSARPVPLPSLGDGVQRILGIALALVRARNGVVFLDEVENGLHYSVQRDLWNVIFQSAQTLNVQVFAVTHSWDCIEAFQAAAAEDANEQALLIRLEQKRTGSIEAKVVSRHDLSVLTREHIEVR